MKYVSDGRKVLYWKRNHNSKKWEIIRENFESRRFDFIKLDSFVLGAMTSGAAH